MRISLKTGWFLILFLGLSACGNAAKKAKPVTVTPPVVSEVEKVGPQEKVSELTVESEPEELAALTYDAAPLHSETQIEVDDDPAKILGLDTQQLVDLLGKPSLVRQESPAEIWQYSSNYCVLDLVLYDAVTTYIEARDPKVKLMDKRACLRELLLSRK